MATGRSDFRSPLHFDPNTEFLNTLHKVHTVRYHSSGHHTNEVLERVMTMHSPVTNRTLNYYQNIMSEVNCVVRDLLYHLEHKMSSNLRCIQFFSAGFRKRIRKVHIPRIWDAHQLFKRIKKDKQDTQHNPPPRTRMRIEGTLNNDTEDSSFLIHNF
jgi:hypothetical protein